MTIREQIEAVERATLSPFAAFADSTAGREREEEPCELRTAFQRDRDRIMHCKAFRRLKHKTQVFLSPEGDHYRTRLTHTLEVSQIARTIARALRLNEDLTEAIALGHDLGHTPFGHAGERVLDEICPYGFSHSAQSLRVVTTLERGHRGLNLTAEVRDGIYKHNRHEPALTREGEIVKIADRIAYINHDIDDACRAGILSEEDLPKRLTGQLGHSPSERITSMIRGVVFASGEGEIRMEPACKEAADELRAFMFDRVYKNPVAKDEEKKVVDILTMLYRHFERNPDKLPLEHFERVFADGIDRVVCDYIAGMSDRYCIRVFQEIFVPKTWNY